MAGEASKWMENLAGYLEPVVKAAVQMKEQVGGCTIVNLIGVESLVVMVIYLRPPLLNLFLRNFDFSPPPGTFFPWTQVMNGCSGLIRARGVPSAYLVLACAHAGLQLFYFISRCLFSFAASRSRQRLSRPLYRGLL